MSCMSQMGSVMAVVPISLFLVLSFFVLLATDKAQTKRLKIFGYVVAVILWLAILVIALGAVNKLASGPDRKKCLMRKEMMMRSQTGMPGMAGMPSEKMPKEGKIK